MDTYANGIKVVYSDFLNLQVAMTNARSSRGKESGGNNQLHLEDNVCQ